MAAKNKDYAKKLYRLSRIIYKLSTQRGVSTRELKEEFDITIRTAQRDIELLNQAGFPMVTLEDGRHAFLDGFSLKKIEITNEEASLLAFLSEIVHSLGESFEGSFRSIFSKVLSRECDSPFYAKIPHSELAVTGYPFMQDLESAIDQCLKVTMHYKTLQGKEKWYSVCPLKIIFYDGFWYLLAWHGDRDVLLKFRLENIKKLDLLGDHFKPPRNLKTILDESKNIWFSEKDKRKVTLHISKEAVKYFKEKHYFPAQKILKTNKDGSLVIECKVGDCREVTSTIMQWMPNIHVLEPKELKETIKKTIDEYRKEL